VTARHSTSKGCPRSPCRDMTRQSKAEPLDAKRYSIGSGRPPSNGVPQGNQGRWGQGPECGIVRRKLQLPGSRRRCHPGPPQCTNMSRPLNKQKGTRLEILPRGRTTSTDELSHPPGWRLGMSGGCATLTDHVKGGNCRITLWPNPLTRPKPRGLLSDTTIRDTPIRILRSL
jgi:hypothetical protein